MLSCGPDSLRAASGASPVKFGVNVGPAPSSVQIGAVVHWLFTSPIRESDTPDRSSVIVSPRQPCAVPYQRRSPSRSRSVPAFPASIEAGRGLSRAVCTEGLVSGPGTGVGGGTTVTSIVPIDTFPGRMSRGRWLDPPGPGPGIPPGSGPEVPPGPGPG